VGRVLGSPHEKGEEGPLAGIPREFLGKRFDELSDEDKLKVSGRADVCWFCGRIFVERQARYDPETDTFECPYCKKSFKDLPPFAQRVLDAEMVSIGLWSPWHNLPRRKRRRPGIRVWTFTRDRFLRWASEYFPEHYGAYRRGEISFEELVARLEGVTGRTIVIS